jgi:hypothetical protein
MKRWPLFAIAACSLILIAVRIVWPLLKFDNTSVVLFAVAVLAVLVAFLPIKRLKWGEFEAELDRDVDKLERQVKATEAAPPPLLASKPLPTVAETASQPSRKRFYDEYIALVNSPASNVEKIIAASIMLDKIIDGYVDAFAPDFGPPSKGSRFAVERLAEQNLISSQERGAFMELSTVRNKIVHEGIRPTDEQTARLLDLVWRLVRTLA